VIVLWRLFFGCFLHSQSSASVAAIKVGFIVENAESGEKVL